MTGDFFAGRADELAVLKDLLVRLANGVGGAVLVEGEQGIGKTALLRQTLGEAGSAGCALRWAEADQLEQRLPLRLMAQCLGAGAGADEVDGGLAGEADLDLGGGGPTVGGGPVAGLGWPVPPGDPVAAGVERLLAQVDRLCAVSPVVLVAEDLQWADDASLLVWERLAAAVGQVPLLLAGSVRPGQAREELDPLRRGLVARGGTVLAVGPLAPREVSELAGRLAGGRPGRRLAGVVRRAGGNPLYARELVEGLVRDGQVRVEAGVAELAGEGGAAVPTSLAEAIGGRLAALRDEAAGVLRWAAVLGQEFTVADLAVVTGRTAGKLMGVIDEAVTAGVLGETGPAETAGAGPRLAFRHGLIRQTLYGGMPRSLRQASHEQAARALASAGAAPERVAAQLAAAPQASGQWVREWLAGAAPVLTYRAPQVVAQLLRTALDPAADSGPHQELLEAGLVTAAFVLLDDEEVVRTGRRLLAHGKDPQLTAEVTWQVCLSMHRAGRHAETISAIAEALARPGLSAAQAARLRALHAMILANSGRGNEAAALAGDAVAAGEREGDRFTTGFALHSLSAVAYAHRDHDGMLAHIDRALEVIGDAPQTTDLRLVLSMNKAAGLGDLDRLAEAISVTLQALMLAERVGTPQLGNIRLSLATEYLGFGRWDEALVEVEQALSLPMTYERSMLLHGLFAFIAGHREDRETAAGHLGVMAGISMDAACWHNAAYPLLAQAVAAEQAGRTAEAAKVLAQCLDPVASEQMAGLWVLLPTLVRLALDAGDPATAAAAAAAGSQEAARERLPVKAAADDYCRGLTAGDPAPVLAAADYYRKAERSWFRATALEDAAVLLAARGELPAARRASGDAARLYRGLGAQWDIRRAAARLRPYGIRLSARSQRARPAHGWDALTPTEAKIAYLIARGQSNPDIAAELWLSRNTVQNHVAHILAKLGARSRAEVVRHAPDGHGPDARNTPS